LAQLRKNHRQIEKQKDGFVIINSSLSRWAIEHNTGSYDMCAWQKYSYIVV
jgi:hypothetical protein